jgi:glutathione-regulated potassium-efflux system ancillary protein KefF
MTSVAPPRTSSVNAAHDILVLVAHPDLAHSRANRALMRAAAALGPRIVVRDLYALYPDYLVDVAAEQRLLAQAKLVVWQHPIHWYHMPALMKLWVDEVLTFGWAYGSGGDALRGKDLWLVASTGGPEDSYAPSSYNRYFFDAFLPPYDQTAALCGMRFLPPLVLHGAQRASDVEIEQYAQRYAEQLGQYPHWPGLNNLPDCAACEVPASARPDRTLEGGAA